MFVRLRLNFRSFQPNPNRRIRIRIQIAGLQIFASTRTPSRVRSATAVRPVFRSKSRQNFLRKETGRRTLSGCRTEPSFHRADRGRAAHRDPKRGGATVEGRARPTRLAGRPEPAGQPCAGPGQAGPCPLVLRTGRDLRRRRSGFRRIRSERSCKSNQIFYGDRLFFCRWFLDWLINNKMILFLSFSFP